MGPSIERVDSNTERQDSTRFFVRMWKKETMLSSGFEFKRDRLELSVNTFGSEKSK